MDLIACTLCYFNSGHDEPLYPHEHHHGQVPVFPCPSCFIGAHHCEPIAPWWCSCDCGLEESNVD